jgi:hypothetical protein
MSTVRDAALAPHKDTFLAECHRSIIAWVIRSRGQLAEFGDLLGVDGGELAGRGADRLTLGPASALWRRP